MNADSSASDRNGLSEENVAVLADDKNLTGVINGIDINNFGIIGEIILLSILISGILNLILLIS